MGIIDEWDTMLPTLRYIEFSERSYTHVYASDGQFSRDNSEWLTNEFPGFSIFKFSGWIPILGLSLRGEHAERDLVFSPNFTLGRANQEEPCVKYREFPPHTIW
jgi:hypothetical protein